MVFKRSKILKLNIDADVVVYIIASALDNKTYEYRGEEYGSIKEIKEIHGTSFERGAVVAKIDPAPLDVLHTRLTKFTEGIVDDSFCSDYQLYLSGKGNFRYKTATIWPYKANRDPSNKPFHYDHAREFLVSMGAEVSQDMEADDLLGLNQTDDTTIATIDKDLMVVPGNHYNINSKKSIVVSLVEANRNFFSQVLTGDTVDNIPGLFGVGAKAAVVKRVQKMESAEEMFAEVYGEYLKRFGSYAEQFMKENMELLWILQTREMPWYEQ